MTKLLLQLVTYGVLLENSPGKGNKKRLRTFELVYFHCQFLHQN